MQPIRSFQRVARSTSIADYLGREPRSFQKPILHLSHDSGKILQFTESASSGTQECAPLNTNQSGNLGSKTSIPRPDHKLLKEDEPPRPLELKENNVAERTVRNLPEIRTHIAEPTEKRPTISVQMDQSPKRRPLHLPLARRKVQKFTRVVDQSQLHGRPVWNSSAKIDKGLTSGGHALGNSTRSGRSASIPIHRTRREPSSQRSTSVEANSVFERLYREGLRSKEAAQPDLAKKTVSLQQHLRSLSPLHSQMSTVPVNPDGWPDQQRTETCSDLSKLPFDSQETDRVHDVKLGEAAHSKSPVLKPGKISPVKQPSPRREVNPSILREKSALVPKPRSKSLKNIREFDNTALRIHQTSLRRDLGKSAGYKSISCDKIQENPDGTVLQVDDEQREGAPETTVKRSEQNPCAFLESQNKEINLDSFGPGGSDQKEAQHPDIYDQRFKELYPQPHLGGFHHEYPIRNDETEFQNTFTSEINLDLGDNSLGAHFCKLDKTDPPSISISAVVGKVIDKACQEVGLSSIGLSGILSPPHNENIESGSVLLPIDYNEEPVTIPTENLLPVSTKSEREDQHTANSAKSSLADQVVQVTAAVNDEEGPLEMPEDLASVQLRRPLKKPTSTYGDTDLNTDTTDISIVLVTSMNPSLEVCNENREQWSYEDASLVASKSTRGCLQECTKTLQKNVALSMKSEMGESLKEPCLMASLLEDSKSRIDPVESDPTIVESYALTKVLQFPHPPFPLLHDLLSLERAGAILNCGEEVIQNLDSRRTYRGNPIEPGDEELYMYPEDGEWSGDSDDEERFSEVTSKQEMQSPTLNDTGDKPDSRPGSPNCEAPSDIQLPASPELGNTDALPAHSTSFSLRVDRCDQEGSTVTTQGDIVLRKGSSDESVEEIAHLKRELFKLHSRFNSLCIITKDVVPELKLSYREVVFAIRTSLHSKKAVACQNTTNALGAAFVQCVEQFVQIINNKVLCQNWLGAWDKACLMRLKADFIRYLSETFPQNEDYQRKCHDAYKSARLFFIENRLQEKAEWVYLQMNYAIFLHSVGFPSLAQYISEKLMRSLVVRRCGKDIQQKLRSNLRFYNKP
uniref:14_3_3 domain-containing protein n=1 Tax=Mesocestoides corti TaxID=53468 RepID=A0A5K3EFT1_MESCO